MRDWFLKFQINSVSSRIRELEAHQKILRESKIARFIWYWLMFDFLLFESAEHIIEFMDKQIEEKEFYLKKLKELI